MTTGYPSLPLALLQGLLTAFALLAPVLVYAFGFRLRISLVDALLILTAIVATAAGTTILFLPFEGDWVDQALGPMVALRTLMVGAVGLTLAMAIAQRRAIVRGGSEAVVRLGAAFLLGAVWGSVWGFSGWVLTTAGMA